jgi:ABC-2 type transport system permease protein
MYDQADEALQALRAAPGERTGFLGSLETFLGSVKQFAEEQEANEGAPQPADGDGEEEAGPAMELLSVDRESVQRESETSGLENAYQVTFPQGVMWGIIGCTAAFGISLVTERVRGSLLRLRMSSLSPAQILGGKALACFVTTLSVAIGLFVLGAVVFGVRPASYGLLALAIVCTCLCFVGIMMLLSVLGKTEQAAGGIGWAVLMILAMFGGAMVPLFIMPGWMKMLSRFSPMYWAILSMEGAVWRGFGLGEMLLPCGVLLGCGAVCFVAGWRAFRWLG